MASDQESIINGLSTRFNAIGSNTPRTRLNFKRAWDYIKKHRRNLPIKVTNTSGATLFCPYLGRSGISLAAGETKETTLRAIGPLTYAAQWYEQLRLDTKTVNNVKKLTIVTE